MRQSKMKKTSILALVLAFMMLFSSTAFAALPDNSVIIGPKGFSIDYLMVPANNAEINQAIADAGDAPIFYQLPGVAEQFTNVFTNAPATQDQLNASISYKNANGEITEYKNQELVSKNVVINSVSATNGSVAVVLSAEPSTTPQSSDFSVNQQVYSNDQSTTYNNVSIFNFNTQATLVTFNIPTVTSSVYDATVTTSVYYKDSFKTAAPFSVSASASVASSVYVDNNSIALDLNGNVTGKINAVVKDQFGNIMSNAPISYISMDNSVVSVDANGNLTAHKVGTADVKVLGGTIFNTVSVTVADTTPVNQGLTATFTKLIDDIPFLDIDKYSVNIAITNANIKTLEITSDRGETQPGTVTVNGTNVAINALFTDKSATTVTITAKDASGAVVGTITETLPTQIEQLPAFTASFNKVKDDIPFLDLDKYTANITINNASVKTLEFTSDRGQTDPSTVTVTGASVAINDFYTDKSATTVTITAKDASGAVVSTQTINL